MSASPFEKVVGQLILGGKSFVESLSSQLIDKSEIKEFTRQQRLIGRPSLEELMIKTQDKPSRNKVIKMAHLDHGYTLKEIADHIGRHYSTINRIVSD
ncbi:helix-turn-helix domain-containing protein [uncultured Desulfuromusa sp.]|uniref:helix-turn-helix domain-containing protein n=1 Tax=uncultured Desulfuromusa sp. TaxID=219183 RepID=UPI002AA6A325|nr:helix-turn-helix domain-containing protein [uncultured Desulfuromusa sp.]